MTSDQRQMRMRRFLRRTYGPLGTLRLHRHALGLDLVRAPLNVVLAPVVLVLRLVALFLRLARLPRAAAWLAGRRILLETDVARALARRIAVFVDELEAEGLIASGTPDTRTRAIRAHVEIRNAVAEIAVMLGLLATGFVLFNAATPGVISLTGPLADLRAAQEAVGNFPLGRMLGRAWYGFFPVSAGVGQIAITGLALAAATSLAATFAGLVTDPIQLALGVHRRRLERLLTQIDRGAEPQEIEKEHVFARLGDLSDVAVNLWRVFRG